MCKFGIHKKLLKKRVAFYVNLNHSKQHSSKTPSADLAASPMFWNHSKQHSSKTCLRNLSPLRSFWNHSKQHSSKTPPLIFR